MKKEHILDKFWKEEERKITRAKYDIIHNKALDRYNSVVNPAWFEFKGGRITLEEYGAIQQPAHSQYIKDLEKLKELENDND